MHRRRQTQELTISFRRLWIAFGAVVVLSFAVLGWTGLRIYQEMPPVPERVVTTTGVEVIGPDDIHRGQNVWQSMGGMEVGSIWGQGDGTITIDPVRAEAFAANLAHYSDVLSPSISGWASTLSSVHC